MAAPLTRGGPEPDGVGEGAAVVAYRGTAHACPCAAAVRLSCRLRLRSRAHSKARGVGGEEERGDAAGEGRVGEARPPEGRGVGKAIWWRKAWRLWRAVGEPCLSSGGVAPVAAAAAAAVPAKGGGLSADALSECRAAVGREQGEGEGVGVGSSKLRGVVAVAMSTGRHAGLSSEAAGAGVPARVGECKVWSAGMPLWEHGR